MIVRMEFASYYGEWGANTMILGSDPLQAGFVLRPCIICRECYTEIKGLIIFVPSD